jgi:hypothetical protein
MSKTSEVAKNGLCIVHLRRRSRDLASAKQTLKPLARAVLHLARFVEWE